MLLGLIVLALPFVYNLSGIGQPLLVWLGFSTPLATLDYSPIFPWFGVVLIGMFFGNSFYQNAERRIRILGLKHRTTDFLELLGKNSLPLYFIHQAVLFPLVYLASVLL